MKGDGSPDEVLSLQEGSLSVGLVREWRLLAQRLNGTSYFQSPDWVLAWWETRIVRPPTDIAFWRSSHGDLEAIVCLSEVRERILPHPPVRVPCWSNAGAGAGDADHCGWPVNPSRKEDVRRWLRRRSEGSTLLFRHMDPESGVPFLPEGGRVIETTRCPRVSFGPDSIPPPRPRGLRKEVRIARRAIERAGVELKSLHSEAVNETLLAQLFDLHERRWRARGVTSSFTKADFELHRKLTASGDATNGPTAVVAVQDGKVVGILYGFRWGDGFSSFQSGWDPGLANLDVGKVLVDEAMKVAAASGAKFYDFLRGSEEYKYRFGGTDRTDLSCIFPHGVSGWVLSGKYRFRGPP